MVNSIVECLLCKASLNLSSGNLDKFKLHLDTEHSAVFDIDLVISVSFLQTEEKERIVETVFPRIKKFFRDVKNTNKVPAKLKIEKRLLEEDEAENIASFYRDQKRRKIMESKYESLEENHENDEDSNARDPSPIGKTTASSAAGTHTKHDVFQSLTAKGASLIGESVSKISNNHGGDNEENVEEADESNVNEAEEDVKSTSERLQNPNEAQCDICDKVMLKKSIRKHRQRIHQIYDSFRGSSFMSYGGSDNPHAEDEAGNQDVSMDQSLLEPQVDIVEEKKHDYEEKPTVGSCNVCQKQVSKSNMSRHMKIHFKSGPSNEHIDDDEDPTEVHKSIEEDIATNDDDIKKASVSNAADRCKICFASFDDLDELKEHFKEVHEIDYDHFENDDEDEVHVDNSDKSDAPAETEYECDQCDAKYTFKDSLRMHKKRKHRSHEM